jgi:hypothetical protein
MKEINDAGNNTATQPNPVVLHIHLSSISSSSASSIPPISPSMSTAKPVYVSSSGTLGSRPLTVRISDTIGQYATMGYLFVETLLSVSKAARNHARKAPYSSSR